MWSPTRDFNLGPTSALPSSCFCRVFKGHWYKSVPRLGLLRICRLTLTPALKLYVGTLFTESGSLGIPRNVLVFESLFNSANKSNWTHGTFYYIPWIFSHSLPFRPHVDMFAPVTVQPVLRDQSWKTTCLVGPHSWQVVHLNAVEPITKTTSLERLTNEVVSQDKFYCRDIFIFL